MLGSSVQIGSPNTLTSTTAIDLLDDILLLLGTDGDIALVNRSTVLNANTALTSVLLGTPVAQALAANSLMISNITANGDIAMYGNLGGNSQQFLFYDTSANILYLQGGIQLKSLATGVAPVHTLSSVAGADPYILLGRDDTGVATSVVTDMLVIQAGAGTNNETAGFGAGIVVKLGNSASEVEERASIDFILSSATNGSETSYMSFRTMATGSMSTRFYLSSSGIEAAVNAMSITAPNVSDGDYLLGKARDSDTDTVVEIWRMAGAADPYFSTGGSQQNKFYNSGITELGGLVGYGAAGSVTISAGGAIAVTKSYHSVVVNGGTGAGADALTSATGGTEGMRLILKPATSGAADQVTVTDGTGAGAFILDGGANFIMDHVDDRIEFIHNGTEWVELSRSSGS